MTERDDWLLWHLVTCKILITYKFLVQSLSEHNLSEMLMMMTLPLTPAQY